MAFIETEGTAPTVDQDDIDTDSDDDLGQTRIKELIKEEEERDAQKKREADHQEDIDTDVEYGDDPGYLEDFRNPALTTAERRERQKQRREQREAEEKQKTKKRQKTKELKLLNLRY